MPSKSITKSITLLWVLLLVFASAVWGQVRPATVTSVSPAGMQRGTTITLTVEGANLAGASIIQFGHPGIHAEITNIIELPYQPVIRPKGFTGAPIEDLFALHRLLIKVHADEQTAPGRYNFRIQTPLGTTNTGALYIGALTEIPEAEPNNTATQAHKVFYPSTVLGTVSSAGDEDFFEFDADAGKTLVFEIQAATLGSPLDSELSLFDSAAKILAGNNDYKGRQDSFLQYTFAQSGTYRIRVTDAMGAGSGRHFYRMNIGSLPYITQVFPLGLRRGTTADLRLSGFNLAGSENLKIAAPADAPRGETLLVQPTIRGRATLNAVRVAIGDHPEIIEHEDNNAPATAQRVTLPVTINGRIDGKGPAPDQDYFRFTAKKGERVAISVLAQQLGSPLDSIVEVLDAQGHAVPRALARPVWQTFVTLNDPGSLQRGMRIDSWSALRTADYVVVGNELLQVEELPKNPDDDIKFRSYRGVRIGYEGTTPESHAINTPMYKVELHPPGTAFAPNGMPLMHLNYVNDDGGQNFGKDSFLLFQVPSDGDYFVRIRDLRGLQGEAFSYRLSLAPVQPDFSLSADPKNPNISPGDAVSLTVTATRLDGFDGPIEIQAFDLPAGLSAEPIQIPSGTASGALILRAGNEARLSGTRIGFKIRGLSRVSERTIDHWADLSTSLDEAVTWISVARPGELKISAVTPREVILAQGQEATLTVSIKRDGGFAGRVPIEVRNLPFGVIVPDIGLNGILITESDSERSFKIEVNPKTMPGEHKLYLVARIETNSPNATEHAFGPIILKIVRK